MAIEQSQQGRELWQLWSSCVQDLGLQHTVAPAGPPGPRVRRGTRRVFCPNAKAAAEQHVVAKKSVVPRRTAQKRPNDRFLKAFVCWFLKAPWKGVVPNPGGKLHNESNGSNPLGDPTWKSLRPESGRSGKDPFLSQWHPPQIDHSILTMGRNENSKVHTF